jgi:hypothetical protein
MCPACCLLLTVPDGISKVLCARKERRMSVNIISVGTYVLSYGIFLGLCKFAVSVYGQAP